MCSAARPRRQTNAIASTAVAEQATYAPLSDNVQNTATEKLGTKTTHAAVEEHVMPGKHANDQHSQWDAFATLQENYESSDDESDEESHTDEGSADGHDIQQQENEEQWNAFESLENNYQSSSDDSESVSDGGSECEEQSAIQPQKNDVECIDLLDSDEEDHSTHRNQQHDLVDSDDEDQMPTRKRRRITKISDHFKPRSKDAMKLKASRPRTESSKDKESPIVLDDSSISEEESPTVRGAQQTIHQPWQRSVRLDSTTCTSAADQSRLSAGSATSQTRRSIPRGNTLPSSSFTCMSGRNDVRGGGGVGVNGVSLQAQNEQDEREKRGHSAPAKAKSTKKRTTKARTRKTTTKKTTRKQSAINTDEDGNEKPKARRRKGWGRKGGRRSRSTSANGRSNGRSNNAWSARERGIRNNRNNGVTSNYMNIRNQENALGNIGGADVRL
jgi:hypothetical protein